ncbi:MAG: hypothetical protein LN546_05110 [Rickettsia endosymbiont of Ecitomorpha arachnoides]|nr:hypothetical protein [Rickettsia endosymbiont of Sceptobius lativentris]MCC8462523.1 hypothetical protein [Rickettsia endosymbiont of Ecitomorpha arachnoides]
MDPVVKPRGDTP